MPDPIQVDRRPDMDNWQGRVDPEPQSERWHQVVTPWESQTEAGFALLGFACDEGVRRNKGRVGAKEGPSALRRTLSSLALHHAHPLRDVGDVVCADDDLPGAQQRLANAVQGLLAAGQTPLVMGGGHEIAFGTWSGLAQHLAANSTEQPPRIGIINFDAHFDLRDPNQGPSSGTPFAQIADACEDRDWPFRYACLGVSQAANTQALFRRADELGVTYREDHAMTMGDLPALRQQLDRFMADCDHLYLTVCLDVFPAATVPGVSAPAARGVPLDVVEPLIQHIAASGRLTLADMAELNPDYDIDQRSARVAARLFHTLTQHWV